MPQQIIDSIKNYNRISHQSGVASFDVGPLRGEIFGIRILVNKCAK